MRINYVRLWIIAAVALHSFASVGFAKDDSEARIVRWLEGTKSIREMCRIGCTRKYGTPEISSNLSIDYIDSHVLLTVKPADSLLIQEARISNPYYSAIIRQNESGWVLLQLDERDSSAYINPLQSGHFRGAFSMVTTGGGILEYVSSGSYEVEKPESRVLLGREFAIVNLKLNAGMASEIGTYPYVSARIWFDVGESHPFPHRVEITAQDGNNATYVYSGFVDTEVAVLPSRADSYAGIFPDDVWISETPPSPSVVTEFDFTRVHETPDQQAFFLSHYGLPEPGFYTPPWPWWLYSSVVGACVLLLGTVLLSVGRRLRRA